RPSSTTFPYTTLFRSLADELFAVLTAQETPEVDEVEAVEVELTRSLLLESMSVLLELLLEDVLDSVEVELVLFEEFEDVELVLRSEEHTSELQSRFDL